MPALIRKLHAAQKKLAGQDGLTLVEVIVAFFIIALVTGLVIHSSMLAINTTQINKTKTLALALINEQIEHMRAMDYDQLGIEGADPQGVFPPETEIDGFQVQYNIHWADADQSYKQVWVSAYQEPMVQKLEALTMIYPQTSSTANGQDPQSYPPPRDLTLTFIDEKILLAWESPDTDQSINEYRVYRNDDFLVSWQNTQYADDDFDQDQPHTYYITAVYGSQESEPSNVVTYEPGTTNGNEN